VLVTANVVPSSPVLVTLMETLNSSETSVVTRAIRRKIPEEGILHSNRREKRKILYIRFEVFTAVTMKNGAFWDVTACGSCKNGRFGGT
jgi:hypothetical protein